MGGGFLHSVDLFSFFFNFLIFSVNSKKNCYFFEKIHQIFTPKNSKKTHCFQLCSSPILAGLLAGARIVGSYHGIFCEWYYLIHCEDPQSSIFFSFVMPSKIIILSFGHSQNRVVVFSFFWLLCISYKSRTEAKWYGTRWTH